MFKYYIIIACNSALVKSDEAGTIVFCQALESSESVIVTSISGTNASMSGTVPSMSGTVSSSVGTVSTIVGTNPSVPGPVSSMPVMVTTNSGTASVFCSGAGLVGTGLCVPSTGSSMAGTMSSLHGPGVSMAGNGASMPGTFPSLAGGVVPVVATSVLMYNQYSGASPAIYGNAVQAQTAYCTYTQVEKKDFCPQTFIYNFFYIIFCFSKCLFPPVSPLTY